VQVHVEDLGGQCSNCIHTVG